jgi:hypothetical protein
MGLQDFVATYPKDKRGPPVLVSELVAAEEEEEGDE